MIIDLLSFWPDWTHHMLWVITQGITSSFCTFSFHLTKSGLIIDIHRWLFEAYYCSYSDNQIKLNKTFFIKNFAFFSFPAVQDRASKFEMHLLGYLLRFCFCFVSSFSTSFRQASSTSLLAVHSSIVYYSFFSY